MAVAAAILLAGPVVSDAAFVHATTVRRELASPVHVLAVRTRTHLSETTQARSSSACLPFSITLGIHTTLLVELESASPEE